MKKVWSLSAVAASVVLLVGCGSSSSTSSSVVETGKAYYLDSAVAGVNYKCGTQEGITGANGEFTFEVGQSCTFYIGDVKLRDMDKALLSDGAKIVEDDLQVAALLQSLDSDGNPDNGITLTAEVVEAFTAALQENGNEGALPTTPEELEAVVASIENNVTEFSGHAVTLEEAQAHLEATQTAVQTEATKALLAGKTLYAYWEEDGEKYVAEVTINADVTSWQYQTILGGSGSGTEGLVVSGDVLSIDHPEEDELDPYKVLAKDQYVELRNINGDSVLYFYYDKVDAESAFNAGTSSSGDEEPITKFSTEWLNGRTLYNLYEEDDGWHIAAISFTENIMSGYDIDNPEYSESGNYTVTSEGYISYYADENNDGVEEEHWIAISDTYDNYLELCWTDDEEKLPNCEDDEYFYYTLDDAQAARDSK